jgi:hypothetical protein
MSPRKKQTSEKPEVLSEKKMKPEKQAKTTTTIKPSKDIVVPSPEPVKAEVEPTLPEPISEQPAMPEKPVKGSLDRGALILGGGLLFLGIVLLLGRLLRIPFGDYLWPFIFIVPGVLVFLTALSTDSSSGEGLSILGGILTTLGLVFLLQTITGLWATWAYVWALVAPTSVGVSQMIYGMAKDRDSIAESGRRLATLGLFMFAIGFGFFELILGISGFGLASFGLPVFPMLLIFFGLIILVRSLFRGR